MDFYDEIAEQYDEITGAGRRGPAAERFVRLLRERFEVRSALDVACGTGLYTLPLAASGVRTVGADVSGAMLGRAAAAAGRAGLRVEWVRAPMQELAGRLDDRFDAVLCMGNSIPHLLTEADLGAALRGFASLREEGGVLAVQLLNYARVLARGERIVGIDRQGDRHYVRFYDFLPGRVRFNVLTIDGRGGQCEGQLHSTELRPWTAGELAEAMEASGCGRVEQYGGLDFQPFDPAESETVLLVARAVRGGP